MADPTRFVPLPDFGGAAPEDVANSYVMASGSGVGFPGTQPGGKPYYMTLMPPEPVPATPIGQGIEMAPAQPQMLESGQTVDPAAYLRQGTTMPGNRQTVQGAGQWGAAGRAASESMGGAKPWEAIKDPAQRAALHYSLDPQSLDQNEMLILAQSGGSRGGPVIDQRVAREMAGNDAARRKVEAEQAALAEKVAQHTEAIGVGQAEGAARLADATAGHAADLEKHNAEMGQLRAEHEDKMTKLGQQIDSNSAEYVKATAGLDPNRWMASGGHRFTAAIASALGAFGAALSHTENGAQRIIDGAIERDIAQQQAGIKAKHEALSAVQQSYVRNQQLFENRIAAKQATKAEQYEVFAAKFDEMGTRQKGTEQGMAAQNAADDYRIRAAEARKNALALENQQLSTRLVRQTTAQPSLLDTLSKAADVKMKLGKAYGDAAGGEKLTSGEQTFVNKQLDKINENAAAAKALDHVVELNADSNAASRFLNVGKGADRNMAAQTARVAYTHAVSGAAATAPEMAQHEHIIGGGRTDVTERAINRGPVQLKNERITDTLTRFQSLPTAARGPALERIGAMLGPEVAAAAARGETTWAPSGASQSRQYAQPEP